jgi:hypothetical protein
MARNAATKLVWLMISSGRGEGATFSDGNRRLGRVEFSNEFHALGRFCRFVVRFSLLS